MTSLANGLAKEVNAERSQMLKLTLADGQEFLKATHEQFLQEQIAFDPVYATRSVVDIVPNPGWPVASSRICLTTSANEVSTTKDWVLPPAIFWKSFENG